MRDFLREGEHIILTTSGTVDIGTYDTRWRLGRLHLTNQRVLFERQGKIQFAAFLEDIVDVRLEIRKWILQHIRQLCISYRASPNDRTRVAYIAVRSPGVWQKAIKDGMTRALIRS